MIDPRMHKLADVLVNYSLRLQAGDKVLVEASDMPDDMTCETLRVARAAGAEVFVTIKSSQVMRALLMNSSESQLQLIADLEAHRMKEMTAYIGLRGVVNTAELSDVPDQQMQDYQKIWWRPVHGETRVRKTRWVVLRYPSPSMAQMAGMSTDAFEDFYFDVCTMDYARMARAMAPLKDLMEKTDRVRIVGPGTELAFSIKGIPAVGCGGDRNIPDGEVFTAPVRDSVNGTIQFNTPTIYQGVSHERVCLEFKGGKIVQATSSNTGNLNKVLDSDEGARYVGEFALGFNPYITRPMKDILFDEKIAGSFHFTPGAAYEDDADNGNRSAVHWDMVCIQTPEAGGGEIWFDDTLVRQDGAFVVPELTDLNPENLK